MSYQEIDPRTLKVNNKQKLQSKHAKNQALNWLQAQFPNAFDTSSAIRPLENGVMKKILAYAYEAEKAGISKSKLREAVVIFTRSIDYLTCLKAQEMRIDLEGNPVTAVTPDEAARAAIKIKRRVENSARNARKILNDKMQTFDTKTCTPAKETSPERMMPAYSDRPTAFIAQSASLLSKQPSPVVIKHKTTRAFDPDAVAKLKEKLGIKQNNLTADLID